MTETTDRTPLSMAIWRYDRTQALYDGRVGVVGCRLDLTDAPLEEIFTRADGLIPHRVEAESLFMPGLIDT